MASVGFVVTPFYWQTWWFRSAALLAFTLSVIAIVRYVSFRRLRRQLIALEQQAALQRERTRIAKDIHDDLGANLTQIAFLGELAHQDRDEPNKAAERVEKISSTARQAIKSLDEIVWAVNPEHDTLDSLGNYLGKYSLDYLGSLGIRCRLDLPVQLPQWLITAEMRHHLFLALKEALNNVVKHASATEVSVSLTTNQNSFTLVARDNGRGFVPEGISENGSREPGRTASRNGLKNMRQRLEKIGGHCEIQSKPGAGTEVKFVVEMLSDNLTGRKFSPN